MKRHFILLLCSFTLCVSINRSVYKVSLSQDGFVQFLNYELAVPPLREFTVCSWVKPDDVADEQTIFSYTSKQDNVKLVRIWIEAGGNNINVNLAGTLISTVPIGLKKNDWRHICFSYQSDYGTWAFYLDGRLLTCEATLSLLGVTLPGGGLMRFGYGSNDEGENCGFNGEMYGINMLLSSTIERNHSNFKVLPKDKPKPKRNKNMSFLHEAFGNNLVAKNSHVQLVKEKHNQNRFENNINNFDAKHNLLSTFDNDERKKPFETVSFPFYVKSTNRNRVHSKTLNQISNERERPNIPPRSMDSDFESKALNHISNEWERPKIPPTSMVPDFESKALNYISNDWERPRMPPRSMVSDFESDDYPSFSSATDNEPRANKNKEIELTELSPPPPPPPIKPFIFKNDNEPMDIPNYETPPPAQKDNQVYGHWSGSSGTQFAHDVLQHLKIQNKLNAAFGYKYESPYITSTPAAPPIDSFPYGSEIFKKVARLRTLKKSYNKGSIRKREAVRNVEIVEHDWRKGIMRDHSLLRPRNVQLTFRGAKPNKNQMEQNLYNSKESFEADIPDEHRFGGPRPHFSLQNSPHRPSEKSPFDIRLEHIMKSNDPHKPKLYDIRLENVMSSDEHEDENHATGGSKSNRKRTPNNKDNDSGHMTTEPVIDYEGATLAASKVYQNNVSDDYWLILEPDQKPQSTDKYNFDKNVKVGNALNEISVFQLNKENKIKSFVGGHDRVPGIETYRSDLDNEKQNVPSSLLPRVCKNLERQDRVLFVQPDGSVDLYGLDSPIEVKNSAIEFVSHNYNKCSFVDSSWASNPYLLINWEKTPVQLFGGATAKKTIDLCGFF